MKGSPADMPDLTVNESFSSEAREVVRGVRAALTETLLSLSADPNSLGAIREAIGINKNLAWKVSKIVQAEDPASVLELMPGAAGIRILLESCRDAGADEGLVGRLDEAIRDYRRLIEVHSGDRATLAMMGRELSPAGRRQRDEQHRKMLFQGASYVWGAQTRALLKLGVVTPGGAGGLLDFASVNGFFDFRRLRPDVTWVMARRHSGFDDGSSMKTAATEPIDERQAASSLPPLMPDFCSTPPPTLQRIEDGRAITFELVGGPIGKTGSLTCVAGAIQRDIPYYATAPVDWGRHGARCDVPSEVMLVDLYIHESLTFAMPPECHLVSEATSAEIEPRRRLLPLADRLQDLGMSDVAPPTPEIPHYRELLETVQARMGFSPGSFQGYRMRIAYPAFPTTLVMQYRLPQAP